MTQTATIDALKQLGFKTDADDLKTILADAATKNYGPWHVCQQLAERELHEREARNLRSRTRFANLGKFAPIGDFDWNHPKVIDQSLVMALCDLAFIDSGDNVLLRGPAGVGKTMIAKNLGLLALQNGYTVRFDSLAGILVDLLKQESLPALERRIRRYTQPSLLIIDEIGYIPCDRRSADLLFNIISRRHEIAGTVITTNLSFKQWASVFPSAACLSALVDRFVQRCHVIDIEANSWREKQSKTFSAQRKQRQKK